MDEPTFKGRTAAFTQGRKYELSKTGLSKRRGSRRADYVNPVSMSHVLAALTPSNRLAVETAIETGLRISDVLGLRTDQLFTAGPGRRELRERITVRESKTDKNRRVYLPLELRRRLLACSGPVFVFPGRKSQYQHRTRQAVAKDLLRARKLLRVPKAMCVSAHSARKMYAVDLANRRGPEAAQRALLHTDPAVTMIYAMAAELTARKMGGKRTDLYI